MEPRVFLSRCLSVTNDYRWLEAKRFSLLLPLIQYLADRSRWTMKKILAGLLGVTLIGATALATTTSAEARWGGWGGWGWGVGGFAAGAVIGSALTAPYYGYAYAPG